MSELSMAMFTPHFEILPWAQQQLWPELRGVAALGFVLYGGTAIALRLGHRQSVDFDFFCKAPLNRAAMQAALPFLARSTVLQDEKNSFSVLVPSAASSEQAQTFVKVSFFGTIKFGRVDEPNKTDDGVLLVAALNDLMATKVKVILQRAEAKDYRDIAHMLKAGVSLEHGLASARAFFGPNFQPSESLKALVYYKDGDLKTLTRDEKETLTAAVGAVGDLPDVAILSWELQ
jgi:Nucleotidyl transferase AbiEii toxin, Type IV TA system